MNLGLILHQAKNRPAVFSLKCMEEIISNKCIFASKKYQRFWNISTSKYWYWYWFRDLGIHSMSTPMGVSNIHWVNSTLGGSACMKKWKTHLEVILIVCISYNYLQCCNIRPFLNYWTTKPLSEKYYVLIPMQGIRCFTRQRVCTQLNFPIFLDPREILINVI